MDLRAAGARSPGRGTALLVVLAVVLPLLTTAPVAAHEEREVTQPEAAPFPEHRDTGPSVVVCKQPGSRDRIRSLPAPHRARNLALLERCRFNHIQRAINWVADHGQPGTRILVLPGVYREEPSRRAHEQLNGAPIDRPDLADECATVTSGTQAAGTSTPALTYPEQVMCPHEDNLITVLGDTTPRDDSIACDGNLCDLQIEGTGTRPQDVIIDGKLDTFLNGIRAARAGGLYLERLTAQHFEFNGVYVIETAGATVDEVVGSFNHEYGFLSFVSHVRYQNCGGQANGDSVVYPGASPDLLRGAGLIPRHRAGMSFSTEVRGCRGHHSALGYSGTTGNAVFVHHNEFDHNAAGLATDSLFPGHPGTPQNHALWEDNLFHSNNVNYFARHPQRGACRGPLDERDYEDGAVCPAVPLPVGTGLLIAGGNFNWVHRNHFYDNWRQGTFQLWVPAELRETAPDPDAHLRMVCGPDGDQPCPPQETSHWNTYSDNRLAANVPTGLVQPNGADFAWDLEGQGNCWDQTGPDANTSAAGAVTYSGVDTTLEQEDLPVFPRCVLRSLTYSPVATNLLELGCIDYDQASNPDPAGCDWFEPLPVPDGRQPDGPTLQRLAGADPVGTAVLASREGYPDGAPTVVLAAADRPTDALVGAPLAHARGGPVLVTSADGLDRRAAAEIQRLGATTALLVGNRRDLSPEIAADLRRLGFGSANIRRFDGATDAATAAEVAGTLNATDAFVVRAGDDGWRDVRTLGSVAALLERPILVTGRNEVPPATSRLLGEGSIEAADVVGGTTAIDEQVRARLSEDLDEVERVGGSDPDAVARSLARFALQAGADPTELWITSGLSGSGAIAAGSAVAVDEGVMLLARDGLAGTSTAAWLDHQHPFSPNSGITVSDVLERVRLLGDTSTVSPAVSGQLRDRYGARPGDARGDRSTGTSRWQGRLRGGGVGGDVQVVETVTDTTRLFVSATGLEPGHPYTVRVDTGACGDAASPLPFPGGDSLELETTPGPSGVAVADTTRFAVSTADPASVSLRHHGELVACAEL